MPERTRTMSISPFDGFNGLTPCDAQTSRSKVCLRWYFGWTLISAEDVGPNRLTKSFVRHYRAS